MANNINREGFKKFLEFGAPSFEGRNTGLQNDFLPFFFYLGFCHRGNGTEAVRYIPRECDGRRQEENSQGRLLRPDSTTERFLSHNKGV